MAGALLGFVMRHKLLVAVLLGALLVAVGGGALSLDPPEIVDPETSLTVNGATGHVHLEGGLDNRGEAFITSGEPTHKSQTIVATGTVAASGLWFSKLCAYQYRVFVNNLEQKAYHSAELVPEFQSVSTGLQLKSHVFALDGRVTGALRVELWVKIPAGFDRVAATGCDWKKVGYDGAKLLDGAGALRLTAGQSDKFEEGDTVKFDVTLGVGHWVLTMYDGRGSLACGFGTGGFNPLSFLTLRIVGPGDFWDLDDAGVRESIAGANQPSSTDPTVAQLPSGAPPQEFGPASCRGFVTWDVNTGTKSTTVSFVVPQGAFVPGGNNVWRASLRNTFMEHATDQIVVLDKKVLAPEPPDVKISNPKPNVGDTVTYTMTARQNLASGKPIANFLVYLWYGSADLTPTADSPAWIARGISVPAQRENTWWYSGAYSIVVKNATLIKARIYAVDADGRPSGSTLNAADVQQLKAEAYTPPANATTEEKTVYAEDVTSDSRPTVAPKGSESSVAGPQPPTSDRSGQVFVLLLVLALVLAVGAFIFVRGPLAVKLLVVFLIVLGVTLYAWFTDAIPGVS